MNCPNCKVEMNIDNYEEDMSIFDDSTISRSWYYTCPTCKKQYIETMYYQMVETTINEIK